MMPDKPTPQTRQAAIMLRVKNESDAKLSNEKKVDIATEHTEDSDQSLLHVMSFGCECDTQACDETIQMSTDEYENVHRKSNNFVVVPSHVKLDIEKIATTFSNYLIVEKLPVPD